MCGTIAFELLETYRTSILTLCDKGYVGLSKKLANPDEHHLIIQRREYRSDEPSRA